VHFELGTLSVEKNSGGLKSESRKVYKEDTKKFFHLGVKDEGRIHAAQSFPEGRVKGRWMAVKGKGAL